MLNVLRPRRSLQPRVKPMSQRYKKATRHLEMDKYVQKHCTHESIRLIMIFSLPDLFSKAWTTAVLRS
ncbi:hypothetical protein ALO95_200107 [Pseudomonas syringae pv. antirrhini]|nr:hypothetical protein ALQ23_200023 [Pseudomonas syringae pv. antirrhini]RMW23479.1 hypothetical protein ALO95_200107 [Pseudomonas syringae pv. antirrhini]